MIWNEKNGKFVVITGTIFIILLSLIGFFVYENQLNSYSNNGNSVNEVIQINLIINLGNGTILYYNNTSVSNNASMLEITKNTVNKQIDVQYYQGWINPNIHDKEKRASTWRLDPEKSGISCCVGDIGTHGFDMIEYVTGMEVKTILADLNYLYADNKMDIDGTILLRFAENVKGVLRTSQIATGEENNFTVKIYGDKGGLKWEQENPNYLHHLTEDEPLKVLKPGHAYNSAFSLDGTKLPPGHPEGIFDSMGNIYKGVAKAIRKEKYHPGEFPTMKDGVRGMNFIERAVASHQQGNVWVEVK